MSEDLELARIDLAGRLPFGHGTSVMQHQIGFPQIGHGSGMGAAPIHAVGPGVAAP